MRRILLVGKFSQTLIFLSLPTTSHKAILTKVKRKFFKEFFSLLNTGKFLKCQKWKESLQQIFYSFTLSMSLQKTAEKRGKISFESIWLYKGGTRMEWLKNLSTAIDYIEDNLDNDISYDEVRRSPVVHLFIFNVFSLMCRGFRCQNISAAEEWHKRRLNCSGQMRKWLILPWSMDILPRLHLTGHFKVFTISPRLPHAIWEAR